MAMNTKKKVKRKPQTFVEQVSQAFSQATAAGTFGTKAQQAQKLRSKRRKKLK